MRPAAVLICQFIDEEKERFGVAPICRALSAHDIQIAPRTYWARHAAAPGKRQLWDTAVTEILPGFTSRTSTAGELVNGAGQAGQAEPLGMGADTGAGQFTHDGAPKGWPRRRGR